MCVKKKMLQGFPSSFDSEFTISTLHLILEFKKKKSAYTASACSLCFVHSIIFVRGKQPFCSSSRYVHCWSHLSMCVCPDDIFWTAQPFVTKLGVVVHCHELECHAMTGLLSFRARTQIQQNITFLLYILDCWSFSKLFGHNEGS